MNQTIEQLRNRKSIREFTGAPVKEEDLQLILQTAQRAPSSINGQQVSLVYTRDKAIIKKIAELSGGQVQIETADVFVTFVIDFNRTTIAAQMVGKEHLIEQSAEGIVLGAVDAGIMLSSLQSAAESLGYGTTAIGGLRNQPDAMIKLLNLPPKTFPVVGSTIGVPTEKAKNAPLKPRVPFESFAMADTYNHEAVKKGVTQYEQDLKNFREAHGMNYLTSYAEQIANFYGKIYFRSIAENLTHQGFVFQDEIK
ncbi:nitroreductase family protein [Sulfurospirillum sp. 1612]|uniref:nitroreductase family protein n=1 Tax=Sulfurospirillum sp. 1612 TaxID=3094835 RepID=UPI002F920F4F